MRFNTPPGWPPPPPGWVAPPGWRPDPTWPQPPAGWPLWVDEKVQPQASSSQGGGSVVVAGVLLAIGSQVTFFKVRGNYLIDWVPDPDFLRMFLLYGLTLVVVGLICHTRSHSKFWPVAVVVSSLGVFSYLALLVYLGVAGVDHETLFGVRKVFWDSGPGVYLAAIGCLLAFFGSVKLLANSSASRKSPPIIWIRREEHD